MEKLFCLVFLQLHLHNNLVTESSHVLTEVSLENPVFCGETLRRWVPDVLKKAVAFTFKGKWSINTMDHLPLEIKEMFPLKSEESLTQRSNIIFHKTAIAISIYFH